MKGSFFLYGATRSGKTHALMTLRPEGRMIVADVEGQIQAEVPNAHVIEFPRPLGSDATPEQHAERLERRNLVLAEAKEKPVVVWPCLTTSDYHSCLLAVQSGRMGDFTTLGVDSLTYLGSRLIAEICGVAVIHKKRDGQEEEAADPVFTALPDFSGQGVRRSMEMKDWQRYAQKMAEMVTGALFVTKRLNMHLVCTALEEKRDIYEGEGQGKRFLRTAQGPMLHGRVSAVDVPPLFMFLFRMVSSVKVDPKTEQEQLLFAAQTVTKNGWPCGVRGEALKALKPFELDPNLHEILERLRNL